SQIWSAAALTPLWIRQRVVVRNQTNSNAPLTSRRGWRRLKRTETEPRLSRDNESKRKDSLLPKSIRYARQRQNSLSVSRRPAPSLAVGLRLLLASALRRRLAGVPKLKHRKAPLPRVVEWLSSNR